MLKRLIPNTCTSANLFFGMCSILSTFHDDLFMASVFILLALVADGLRLQAWPFSKVLDIDHVTDIQQAAQFLSE